MAVHYGEALPDQDQLAPHQILPPREHRLRKRFTMIVHPHNWEWAPDLDEWVPRIDKFSHDPGVQGVGMVGEKQNIIDIGPARDHYRNKGYMDIPDGDRRLEPVLPGGKYMARFRVQIKEGLTWCYGWVWEGYEKLGQEVHWDTNIELLRKVQQHLVSSGTLPEMSVRLKRAEIHKQKRRIRRLSDRRASSPNPNLDQRLAGAMALLEKWEKDLDAQESKRKKKAK